MFNPFIERKVRVTVTVARSTDGQIEPDVYTFVQNRMRIAIRQGGQQFGNARAEIFGVPLDTMNVIARLWLSTMTPQNSDTLLVEAWDGLNYVPVFQGVITWAAPDGGNIPAMALIIEANSAMALMNTVAVPYANAGPVALHDTLSVIVAPANFVVDFSAQATNYMLVDQRVSGTPLQQVTDIMRQFPDLSWFTNLQRLVVRRVNAPYSDDSISINVSDGAMRLPSYSSSGLQFQTVFQPRLRPGIICDIKTVFEFVNQTKWVAAIISHQLEPNVPGGQWLTSVAAQAFGTIGNNQ